MTDRTRVALVGQGISASLTPAMHMTEARALGFDYAYGVIDTGTLAHAGRTLGEIVATAQLEGMAGLNITYPHKIAVLGHMDQLSDDARRLGAVNTVVFRGARKVGHNTDFSGFHAAFKQDLPGAPLDRVLLLGAGGAGVAVGFALLSVGVKRLMLFDQRRAQSEALARKLQSEFPDREIRQVETFSPRIMSGVSGVVNATPMGMDKYPGSALPLALLHGDLWVSDIVYFPLETALLAQARALGCRIMPGSAMAVWQAVHAFELFTGTPADPARMGRIFAPPPGQV
ncbi:MAG: shikimate dehydrogenase [Rhodobacteraceae bacterium]|nr:shikimate dehydrogenase [Paracoccaceae bacterium]